MRALFILQMKSFFKSAGSVFTFVLPLVLLIILGYTIPSGWIIPSVISIGILSTALFQFGTSLEEIKRTAFMKSVGLTKLNKFTTFITFLLFTLIVTILGIVWLLFWSWFLTVPVQFLAEDWGSLAPSIPPVFTQMHWENVQWGNVVYSWIINITLSFSIAFFFLAISNTSESYNFLSIGYVFVVLFLGGVLLPHFLITLSRPESGNKLWIEYASLVVPHYWMNGFSIPAFGGISDQLRPIADFLKNTFRNFDPDSIIGHIINYPALQPVWGTSKEQLENIILPLVFTGIFTILGTTFLKW